MSFYQLEIFLIITAQQFWLYSCFQAEQFDTVACILRSLARNSTLYIDLFAYVDDIMDNIPQTQCVNLGYYFSLHLDVFRWYYIVNRYVDLEKNTSLQRQISDLYIEFNSLRSRRGVGQFSKMHCISKVHSRNGAISIRCTLDLLLCWCQLGNQHSGNDIRNIQ